MYIYLYTTKFPFLQATSQLLNVMPGCPESSIKGIPRTWIRLKHEDFATEFITVFPKKIGGDNLIELISNPMTDPYVCHIWIHIYHQYTPVLLALIYCTWIRHGYWPRSFETFD